MKNNLDIICFGDQWDDFFRRRQALMYYLSKNENIRSVLYIERPLTVFSLIKYILKIAPNRTAKRWKRLFS